MQSYKLLSWNINGVQGAGRNANPHQKAFEHQSLTSRWPKLFDEVLANNPDIACLFENSRSFLDIIETDLRKHFRTVKSFPYAPNQSPDMSLYFTLASNIELDELYVYYATDTPLETLVPETRKTDSILLKFNEGFEKAMIVSSFHFNEQQYVFAVTHLGLRYPYQQQCSDMFSQHIRERYPEAKVIVTGDFNTFPTVDGDSSTYERRTLESFTKYGYIELVGDQNTFCGFSDDFGLLRSDNAKAIVANTHQFAANTEDMESIRERCAETILELRDGPIVSGLDRVLTNMKDLHVDVKLIIPTHEEFVLFAKEGNLINLSDHALITMTF